MNKYIIDTTTDKDYYLIKNVENGFILKAKKNVNSLDKLIQHLTKTNELEEVLK